MFKSLISETAKIGNLLKLQGISGFNGISKNESFIKLWGLAQGISQDLLETHTQVKFESVFKLKTNVFLPLSQNDDFNIGVFFIPKGSRMPLHDHPQMLVLSKVLTGTLKFTSVDFCDHRVQMEIPKKLYRFLPVDGFGEEVLRGRLNVSSLIKTMDMMYLTPEEGNIHEFEAQENSAILDIFVPKYDLVERFCNFYEITKIVEKDVYLKYLFPPPDYECMCLEGSLKL